MGLWASEPILQTLAWQLLEFRDRMQTAREIPFERTFCYIMNMSEIPTNDLSCIKDYGLYEDDYDSDDEDDDKLFSIQKYEHNFYHTINDILENEKETTL